jgi:hypothetical protein
MQTIGGLVTLSVQAIFAWTAFQLQSVWLWKTNLGHGFSQEDEDTYQSRYHWPPQLRNDLMQSGRDKANEMYALPCTNSAICTNWAWNLVTSLTSSVEQIANAASLATIQNTWSVQSAHAFASRWQDSAVVGLRIAQWNLPGMFLILLIADFVLRTTVLTVVAGYGAQIIPVKSSFLRAVGFDPLAAMIEPQFLFPCMQVVLGCFVKLPALWCKIEIFAVFLSLECRDSGCGSLHQVVATGTQAAAIFLAALSISLMIWASLQNFVRGGDIDAHGMGSLVRAVPHAFREGLPCVAIVYSIFLCGFLLMVASFTVQLLTLCEVFFCDIRKGSILNGRDGCEPVQINPNCSCASVGGNNLGGNNSLQAR